MKLILKYDQDGYYIAGEDAVIGDDDVIPEGYTDIPLPVPNWLPRFDGKKWIETANEEQREAIQNPYPPQKTEFDILKEKFNELENALLEISLISADNETNVGEDYLVKIWARNVKNGNYARNEVPSLSNLKEMVFALLDKEEILPDETNPDTSTE